MPNGHQLAAHTHTHTHTHTFTNARSQHAGNLCLSGSIDCTTRMWDVRSGRCLSVKQVSKRAACATQQLHLGELCVLTRVSDACQACQEVRRTDLQLSRPCACSFADFLLVAEQTSTCWLRPNSCTVRMGAHVLGQITASLVRLAHRLCQSIATCAGPH